MSEVRVLEQYLLLYLYLGMCFSSAFGQNTCGQFSYHRHQLLDNQTFTQGALQVKVYIPEKALAECSSDCFRHRKCKMFVLNSNSGECRSFKRAFFDLTKAMPATGFKYYAADCHSYKPNVCQTGFSFYQGTVDFHCYNAGAWEYGSSDGACKQDEWINLTENSVPLPSSLVAGVIINIRGSRSNDRELSTALRDETSVEKTRLLRVSTDGTASFRVYTSVGWSSYTTVSPFSAAPGLVFDLQVIVSPAVFQIQIDGATVATLRVGLPLNSSTMIRVSNWLTVERVKLTYP